MSGENPWLNIEERLQRLIQALIMLILSILAGMAGSHFLEGYNWRQAFFKTVITVSTIGELHIRAKTGATVIGYKCKDKGFTFNPGPDTRISQDSILIILGTVQTIENLRRVFLKHDDY